MKNKCGTLVHALSHHAKGLAEIVPTLHMLFNLELAPLGWEMHRSGKGFNSTRITSPDGVNYHFRARKSYKEIEVLDNWKHGKVVATIRTRVDALRFIESLATP